MRLTTLTTADDVSESVLEDVESCVADWYSDRTMPVEDFIDTLCERYGDGWDIEQLDTPAVRKIMRHARATKRELA